MHHGVQAMSEETATRRSAVRALKFIMPALLNAYVYKVALQSPPCC